MRVINDILDYSKIEAGKLDLDPIEFVLRDLVEETLEAIAIRAHQKGLELACEIHPDVPERVLGDPGRLRQVFNNLVGNSIKFTERGEIVVSVNVRGQAGSDLDLGFAVTDTGIGIAPEKQRLIFEPFAQADGSTTPLRRDRPGTDNLLANRGADGGPNCDRERNRTGQHVSVQRPLRKSGRRQVTGCDCHPTRLEAFGAHCRRQRDQSPRLLAIYADWKARRPPSTGSRPPWPSPGGRPPPALRIRLLLLDSMMPDMDGFALAESLRTEPAIIRPPS